MLINGILAIIYGLFQLAFPIGIIFLAFYAMKKSKNAVNTNAAITNSPPITSIAKIVCPKCGYEMTLGNKRCPKCGESVEGVAPKTTKKYVCDDCKTESEEEIKFCAKCGSNKISVIEEEEKIIIPAASDGKPVDKNAYANYLYSANEDSLIAACIDEELKKTTVEKHQSITGIEIRRTIMTAIYCVILLLIVFLYVSYHTNILLIFLALIVLTIIFLKIISKSGLKKHLIKEVKSRPDEKVSYVIASTLSSQGCNKFVGLGIRLVFIIITICLPFILFKEPHLVYEKVANGYNLRYYTLGLLKNDKVVEVPSKYKGENVIGIRGDTFENVYFLEKVVLPETIEEIRSGAFKNCPQLKEINIPSKVKVIAANTFQGCTSLEKIDLPETIEEIRGDAFNGCTNLKEITLPSKITEIHGGTFQSCSSLQKIVIPEGVTRIGGSAFRYCSSLTEVTIPKTVTEIGSSAFRETGLSRVCIPQSAYVNERAFKGTYAKITYYENDCKLTGETYYNEWL